MGKTSSKHSTAVSIESQCLNRALPKPKLSQTLSGPHPTLTIPTLLVISLSSLLNILILIDYPQIPIINQQSLSTILTITY